MTAAENIAENVDVLDEEAEIEQEVEVKNEFLTFFLAKEEYGVDILRVQEIRGWESVTRIPNTPLYVKGVMNLRGAIVPVVDLRDRFGLENAELTNTTVVVVLRVIVNESEKIVGIVVDGVSGVIEAAVSEVARSPEFGGDIKTEFISGLVNQNDVMVMLLDVEKLLASECMSLEAETSDS
ncbi:MAG: chemotaxis protein CheW [Methylococcales bacterium]|jgi:purine-binding chemotaxis protein CheW|nr:chemotaxis protein CheW [Methylococcales bacterium]